MICRIERVATIACHSLYELVARESTSALTILSQITFHLPKLCIADDFRITRSRDN